MNRTEFAAWIFVVMLVIGCAPPHPSQLQRQATPRGTSQANHDALVQFSLLAALASGDYVDGVKLRDMLADGDFGLGTFDGLDGEMIVLDGKVYQARGDGTVRTADLDGGTPFAEVKFFHEDGRLEKLAAATLEDLDRRLDLALPRRNVPYAIRIDGEFAALTLRSVPAQSPPFRPLVEVVKGQPTWEHKSVRGTLVGFRCPAWVGTLNVPGYHWHFLSDDRQIGGHLLACQFENCTLRYDECTSVLIRLPTSAGFEKFDATSVKGQDINAIERQREKK